MKEQPGTVFRTKPGRWMEEGGGWVEAGAEPLPKTVREHQEAAHLDRK